MTVEQHLRSCIDLALAAGHCHPTQDSDRGQCLIDHVALGHRDRIELREEVERLRDIIRRAYLGDTDDLYEEGEKLTS